VKLSKTNTLLRGEVYFMNSYSTESMSVALAAPARASAKKEFI